MVWTFVDHGSQRLVDEMTGQFANAVELATFGKRELFIDRRRLVSIAVKVPLRAALGFFPGSRVGEFHTVLVWRVRSHWE